MNKVSEQLSEQLYLYNQIRPKYLAVFTRCQAQMRGCQYFASQVHHKQGRGLHLLDLETWLAVCPHCHQWIELHPTLAKAFGFSLDRLTTDKDIIDLYGNIIIEQAA